MKEPRKGSAAAAMKIDELHVHVRGVTPATARSAADQLGPALARALAGRALNARSIARVDSNRMSLDAQPSGTALAERIAARIADTTTKD